MIKIETGKFVSADKCTSIHGIGGLKILYLNLFFQGYEGEYVL